MLERASRVMKGLADTRRRYGLFAVLCLLLDDLMKLLVNVDIVHVIGVGIDQVGEQPQLDPEFSIRCLTAEDVRTFAVDPSNELGAEFAQRIPEGQNVCLAAVAGERLAAYSWYALESIEPEHASGIAMSYAKRTVYTYKAFTHPHFRGRRLIGVLLVSAFHQLARRGARELVAHVSWINFPSLRAFARVGFKLLGRVVVLRLGRRQLVFVSPALKAHGLRFGTKGEAHPR